MFDAAVFSKFLIAYLAMVNPLYGVPVFIAMTKGYTRTECIRTALIVSATVLATGLIAVLAGEEILSIFGIGIPSFRVAGGIIVLGIGLAMMHADSPRSGDQNARDAAEPEKKNVAVVPLAIPLTIGPGAIVTAIVFAHQLSDGAEIVTLVPAVGLVTLLLAVSLFFATPIARLLGDTVMSVMSRILAIILVGIAVEMILTGLGAELLRQFPGLGNFQ